MILKLLSWFTTFLEKIRSKPYFLQVSFMRIFRQNLFNCNFPFRRTMNPKPYHTKPSSSKQTNSFKILRKSLSKFIILICSKISSNIKIILISSIIYFNCFFFIIFRLINIIISFLNT